MRTGHSQNFLCATITFVVYAASYLLWRIVGTVPPGRFPPIFYVLLLLLVLLFLLQGLSFWLDRYRVPTILLVSLVSFVLFLFNRTDHYYELDPERPASTFADLLAPHVWELFGWMALACGILLALLIGRAFGRTFYRKPPLPISAAYRGFRRWWVILAAAPLAVLLFGGVLGYLQPPPPRSCTIEPLSLQTVFDAKGWKFGGKGATPEKGRTLVVVTAEGGGIQASAWAARVLTGLHKRYGKDFTRSIGLISGVSGGGVGAMYYLANWRDGDDDPLTDCACDNINRMSRASCMEASAWGITFPDFLRLGAPMFIPENVDRGWALEKSWLGQLQTVDGSRRADDWRLADMQDSVSAGRAPVPVFNATLVESGQRLLISPVSMFPSLPAEDASSSPVEFLPLFRDEANNLRVSTAARLSAGFAYVSPVCCARRKSVGDSNAVLQSLTAAVGVAAAGRRTILKSALERVEALKNAHVVDGGYVDNEGVFTVVDWLHYLTRLYGRKSGADRPFGSYSRHPHPVVSAVVFRKFAGPERLDGRILGANHRTSERARRFPGGTQHRNPGTAPRRRLSPNGQDRGPFPGGGREERPVARRSFLERSRFVGG